MRTLRPLAFVLLSLLLAAPAGAQERDPLRFSPTKRVFLDARLAPQAADFADLAQLAKRLEAGKRYRYYTVVLSDVRRPIEVEAQAILRSWRRSGTFFPESSYVLVCAAQQGELHLTPPISVRDRLALTPTWIDQLLRPHAKGLDEIPAKDRLSKASAVLLSGELQHLWRSLEKRVSSEQESREAARVRRSASNEDRVRAMRAEAQQISLEIGGTERRLHRLVRGGFGLIRAQQAVSDARLSFAGALAQLDRFHPDSRENFDTDAVQLALAGTRQHLTNAKIQIETVERARDEFAPTQARVQAQLQRLSLRVDEAKNAAAANPSAPRVRPMLEGLRNARRVLMDAERLMTQKRPVEALSTLERADQHLQVVERRLDPPAVETTESPEGGRTWGFWLKGIFGVLCALAFLALALGHVIHLIRRGDLAEEAEELADATRRMSHNLRQEVLALRTHYLTAAKPAPIAVPEFLLPADRVPPQPRAYTGVTAAHLADAYAVVADLHSLWRSLEVGLETYGVLRKEDRFYSLKPLRRCIETLNDVPARNLPVTKIRSCANALVRISNSRESAEVLLDEVALALEQSDALLHRVLSEQLSAHSFDDEYADLVEKAFEAAFMAAADPVRACRLSQRALRLAEQLTEKVQRTLELAEQRAGLVERLGPINGAQVTPAALYRWSRELGEQVSRHLDDGSRDQARRDLERATELVEDAARLSADDEELETLREELSQAHEGFKELERDFARASWEDLQGDLHRAAARIELLEEDADVDAPRAQREARAATIRRALLAVSVRQLALQGQRERSISLLGQLAGRAEGLRNYAAREERSIAKATASALDDLTMRLHGVRRTVQSGDAGGELPDWEQLLADLKALDTGFEALRKQSGEDVLRYHRAQVLRKSLRDRRDGVTRALEDDRRALRPGARTRLKGVAVLEEQANAALEKGDFLTALVHLQEGVRGTMDARGIALFIGARDRIPDRGYLGDAQFHVILAGRRLGEAHRLYLQGLTSDPGAGWELLNDARAALAKEDAAGALQLAEQAVQAATAASVAARIKAIRHEDAERVAILERALAEGVLRMRSNEWIRRSEQHRRARYEILALDEDPTADLGSVDLDAEDSEEELALETATEEPKAVDPFSQADPFLSPPETRITRRSDATAETIDPDAEPEAPAAKPDEAPAAKPDEAPAAKADEAPAAKADEAPAAKADEAPVAKTDEAPAAKADEAPAAKADEAPAAKPDEAPAAKADEAPAAKADEAPAAKADEAPAAKADEAPAAKADEAPAAKADEAPAAKADEASAATAPSDSESSEEGSKP